MVNPNNPLAKHFRQPAVYITLPSGGKYSPPGTVNFDNAEELAVYPMTARDEMSMNTPDALLNGQSTVDVIKSCVPSIQDPWQLPVMDLDTVLIAIRIASFGESMDMEVNVPTVNKPMTFTTDLRTTMDAIDRSPFQDHVQLSAQLTVQVRPTNYRQLTNLQLKAFEEQRLVQQLTQNTDMTPTQKQEHFNKIFRNMTDLTINNMIEAIAMINSEGEKVDDFGYIKEFVDNMDSKTANKIRDHIESQNSIGRLKPFTVTVPEDLVAEGAPKTFEAPLTMDNSNFFASRYSRSRRLS